MNIEFFYLTFILALVCFILSFPKVDGFDGRVIFTLSSAVLFSALTFGSFFVELTDYATGTVTAIYSTSFAYVCMYFVALSVVRLIIIVTALLTTKDLDTHVNTDRD